MFSTAQAIVSERREVEDLLDAFRKSVRATGYLEPEWYWKDIARHRAFIERLHHMTVSPAEHGADIKDALAPVIALASQVVARYTPVTPALGDACHEEAMARAETEVAISAALHRPSERTIRQMVEALAKHRVFGDRLFHSSVVTLKLVDDDLPLRPAA